MPPDFDELPLPDNQSQNLEKAEETDIKSLISNNEKSSNDIQSGSNQNSNFER